MRFNPVHEPQNLRGRYTFVKTTVFCFDELSSRSRSTSPSWPPSFLSSPKMKTSKVIGGESSSHRRAQPLRQARTNPSRPSISNGRGHGGPGSVAGDDKDVEIFPAITHFADAITALPKELVRHFTLLKEVDAKIYAPEEQLHRLVAEVLNAPLPKPDTHQNSTNVTAPASVHGSVNGSAVNGYAGSHMELDVPNPAVYTPANFPRRQRFQETVMTMTNMLVALDEKNHVISTAWEALNKQLGRIDDVMPYLDNEISEEARYGSTTHWAYPENRVVKTHTSGGSRKEIVNVNTLSAAAQLMVDEAAARSDARKQALLEKRKGRNPVESDFDENDRHRKSQGGSKVRKPGDAAAGLGISTATNGNPPKRRKVEKSVAGGTGMERSLSGVFGSSAARGKNASPRGTPNPEGKKRSRIAPANGTSRKRYALCAQVNTKKHANDSRNGTVTSAMSPSLASSPVRSTFPDFKSSRPSPPPTSNSRPSGRGRQNSIPSTQDKRPPSVASGKQNGTSTPNLEVAALATGRSIPEIKASMKESASNSREHLLEDVDQAHPEMVGALLVGNRKNSTTKDLDLNGDSHPSTTTKSGRASKPSTPAIPSFPDSARSRSSRNDTSSIKRSHKKGAGHAAHLVAQQSIEDDAQDDEDMDEDGEGDANEPRYCICNQVSFGEMVGCDNDSCVREWFHLGCVGLRTAPKANGKFCNDMLWDMVLIRI